MPMSERTPRPTDVELARALPYEPVTWSPGIFIAHRGGAVEIVARRKDDNSGWWLLDHGGLADTVAVSGDWVALTPEVVRRLFGEHT